MAELIMTPANKDWDRIPKAEKDKVDNSIAMACRKHGCTPNELAVSATFQNGKLELVRTKLKGTQ